MENIRYVERHCAKGFGELIITGLKLPHDDFDPIGRIWSSVRKRILEQYAVDVVGLFVYDDAKSSVTCNFCLNYSILEGKQVTPELYINRFEETFCFQLMMFEEALEAFITDKEKGLEAYRLLAATEHVAEHDFKSFFNKFLRSINVRTERDDARSAKKKKRIERERKRLATLSR